MQPFPRVKSILSGLVALFTVYSTEARDFSVLRIPNGSAFLCATCHVSPNGGDARNPFGRDVEAAIGGTSSDVPFWDAALAAFDSDGDGFTNGQELGDPDGDGIPTPGHNVTNPGNASSKPAGAAPNITLQPVSQTVIAGGTVTFTVSVTGAVPLSYQWQKNETNVLGATSATLTLNSVTSANAGGYTVIVSNGNGNVTSAVAILTVTAPISAPAIIRQPSSQTVNVGATVIFTVGSTGSEPLAYQWRKDGADIQGANTTTLTLNNVTEANAGVYVVVVSNSAGNAVSSGATLTVSSARLPPAIITQPADQIASTGANVTFIVVVTGSEPLSFQWRKNGANIQGANSATLALSNITAADAGNYSVLVTNRAGSASSVAATLTVNPTSIPPTLTTQPQSQTVIVGANVTFSVAATGTQPLAYQWQKDGVLVQGAINAVLALSNVSTVESGDYSVTVSNSGGSVASAVARLTVLPVVENQPPRFTSTAITTATIGIPYQYVAAASDPENNQLIFTKVGGPDWLSVSAVGEVAGTPPELSAGSFLVALRVTDNGVPGQSADQSFILGVSASFAGWQATHFALPADEALAQPLSDPDGDRLVNLAEYAFRTNPRSPDPLAVVLPNINSQGQVQFILNLRDDDPRLLANLEAAGEVGFQNPKLGTRTAIDSTPGDGLQTVQFTDPVVASQIQGQRFWRVKLSLQP